MKQAILSIIALVFVAALLLLWLVGGTDWLQVIYLWIARLENSAQGVDGITEASRVKVMDDAVRHFAIYAKICKTVALIGLLIFCLAGKRRMDRIDH